MTPTPIVRRVIAVRHNGDGDLLEYWPFLGTATSQAEAEALATRLGWRVAPNAGYCRDLVPSEIGEPGELEGADARDSFGVPVICAADMTEPIDEQILTLRDEAGEAGDLRQVAICNTALRGDAEALAECARVIADAAAQTRGTPETPMTSIDRIEWPEAMPVIPLAPGVPVIHQKLTSIAKGIFIAARDCGEAAVVFAPDDGADNVPVAELRVDIDDPLGMAWAIRWLATDAPHPVCFKNLLLLWARGDTRPEDRLMLVRACVEATR